MRDFYSSWSTYILKTTTHTSGYKHRRTATSFVRSLHFCYSIVKCVSLLLSFDIASNGYAFKKVKNYDTLFQLRWNRNLPNFPITQKAKVTDFLYLNKTKYDIIKKQRKRHLIITSIAAYEILSQNIPEVKKGNWPISALIFLFLKDWLQIHKK